MVKFILESKSAIKGNLGFKMLAVIAFFNRLLSYIKRKFKIYVLKDEFELAISRYVRLHKNNEILYDHDLNTNSVVMDLGAYKGEFTAELTKRYSPRIFLFEPIKEYYDLSQQRFASDNKISCYNFAVGVSTQIRINKNNNKSSTYFEGKQLEIEVVDSKSISDVISQLEIKYVDLMKLNVEGSEFTILKDLIDFDMVSKIHRILVQFHTFVPNSAELRREIRKDLQLTHREVFNFPFVWEYWIKQESS
jgi:FkbM family methyltransferase